MYKISGLDGTRALKLSDVTAPALINFEPQFGNRQVRPIHDWMKPLPEPSTITLLNRGGQRGVLPCGSSWNYQRVIRRPAGNKFTGLYPQQGYGRSQALGLAYLPEKPTNLPILRPTSSTNAALPSAFGGIQ